MQASEAAALISAALTPSGRDPIERPLSRASLEWFGTLHAARMAAVVLAEGHTHDPALAAGAEWRPTLRYLLTYVRDRTGIDLTVSGA